MRLLGSGEALVHVLELVVHEVLVLLQLVVLASQELVELREPGAVEGLSVLKGQSERLRAGGRGGRGSRGRGP